jgi:hypothetical protein
MPRDPLIEPKPSDVTVAAYAYVESVKDTADDKTDAYPMWYGWALRVAFLEGAKWAREHIARVVKNGDE